MHLIYTLPNRLIPLPNQQRVTPRFTIHKSIQVALLSPNNMQIICLLTLLICASRFMALKLKDVSQDTSISLETLDRSWLGLELEHTHNSFH